MGQTDDCGMLPHIIGEMAAADGALTTKTPSLSTGEMAAAVRGSVSTIASQGANELAFVSALHERGEIETCLPDMDLFSFDKEVSE